tara:strand:- start:178 stop:1944 length:1767 start_codon:yes stop_codon:yes gene_type:complete
MVSLSSLRQQVEAQQGTTGLDSAEVSAIAGSGVAVYETLDSLPSTGLTAGDEAFVKSSYRLYVSNGDGWYNTTLVNRNPRWDSGGEPDATYTIQDSATPLIITARAIDSDNANLINQSVASDSAQYMATISNDSSVWTFTPKTASQIGASVAAGDLSDSNGDFIYTFKWSDGVSVLSKPVTISYSPAGAAAGFSGTLTEDLMEIGSSSAGVTGQALRSFTSSVTGTTFYWSGGLSDIVGSGVNYGSKVDLTTNPGGTFYIAMIGGGGGTGYRNAPGGNGGTGVVQVTVPPGVTSMTIFAGGGGMGTNPSAQGGTSPGGTFGGGTGGQTHTNTSSATYSYSSSGGGLTGLFYNSSFSLPYAHPNFSPGTALAVVGGGGGCGAANNDYGGSGGGFNQDGARGRSNGSYRQWNTGAGIGANYSNPTNNGLGERATTTAGGRTATRTNSYHGQGDNGTQYNGGYGADSQYDGGGGGGGGYYGGGGGGGGGGFDGGTGGGGSGYANLTYATIMQGDIGNGTQNLNRRGNLNDYENDYDGTWDTTIFTKYVAAASGATDFTLANLTGGSALPADHGRGETTINDRNPGQFVLWS